MTSPTDDDLIRRGDALAEIELYRSDWSTARDEIAALPAALDPAPRVNETPKSEHDRADVLTAIEPAPVTLADALKVPEVQAAVDALDNLLEAVTAEDWIGDRALAISGPTANLKWLIEAGDEARSALRAIGEGKA